MKTIWIILGVMAGLGLLWLIIGVPIFGFHYETGRGEHTGFVTATEKHGIFFKTNTAYLKTDTQSSQEDNYCVIDEDVYSQLQRYSVEKTHLNVYFFSYFSAGIKNCDAEEAIIYKAESTK